jgi:hypothetical protein
MHKKVSLIVLIGAIGLLILIAGLFYTNTAALGSRVNDRYLYTDTAPGSRVNDRYQTEIEFFEEELKNPQLSPEVRQVLQDKLDIVKSEATQWAHGSQHPGTHGEKANPPIPTLTGGSHRLPDGIDNDPIIPQALPAYDNVSKINNAWRKTTPTRYYLVYAGYLATDRKQGMVLVFQLSNGALHQYLTPRKSGPVRIVKEAWPYLILESESGDTFYFDPTGERFIDSLNAPTLAPTQTPIDSLDALTPTPTRTLTPVPYPFP